MNPTAPPLDLKGFVAQLDFRFPDSPVFLMRAGGGDVKFGNGMFWLTEQEACELLKWLTIALSTPFDLAELDSPRSADGDIS